MIIEHTAVLQGLIRYGVREREEPAYMYHIIIYIEAIKGPISTRVHSVELVQICLRSPSLALEAQNFGCLRLWFT